MQMSLDGYIEGPRGEFDWPIVEDELHQYFNDQLRTTDTFLYGRRVYEMMAWFWPTVEDNPDASPRHGDYARIWKPMPKLAFSNTLENAEWNTRIVRSADLVAEVSALKEQPETQHILFGGAAIAATFQQHDLIDEYRLFVHPVILGGGKRLFAENEQRANLTLVGSRTYDPGVLHLHYRRTDP